MLLSLSFLVSREPCLDFGSFSMMRDEVPTVPGTRYRYQILCLAGDLSILNLCALCVVWYHTSMVRMAWWCHHDDVTSNEDQQSERAQPLYLQAKNREPFHTQARRASSLHYPPPHTTYTKATRKTNEQQNVLLQPTTRRRSPRYCTGTYGYAKETQENKKGDANDR